MSHLLLAYYADDFTGSTDALEVLTTAGVQTVLFMQPPTPEQLFEYPSLQAIGVAGASRAMTPDQMDRELPPVLNRLRTLNARHVHYKVCSTFDSSPTTGSIGRVIDLAAKVFHAPFVPLIAAAPHLGRHCVFGHHFASVGIGAGTVRYRLDRHPVMSQHPTTPIDESDLRLHLGRQTSKQVALMDILQVNLPEKEAAVALERILQENPDVVLFDILYAEQLPRIGKLIDDYATWENPLFSVGSSGVEMALTTYWHTGGAIRPITRWPSAERVEPLLVGSGSCSPVTASQIQYARSIGFAEVVLDTARIIGHVGAQEHLNQAASDATRLLLKGRSVMVHTTVGADDPRIAATRAMSTSVASHDTDSPTDRTPTDITKRLGIALGGVLRDAIEQAKPRRLCIAGGDTSSHAVAQLGISSVKMVRPLSPGAPLCKASASSVAVDGIEIVLKGGQVGGADFFEIVRQGGCADTDPGRMLN